MKNAVYQYQSAFEYLKDAIAEKKRIDPDFSIRRFCRQIDFGSHAYLVMILKGKRPLTLKQVHPLAAGLGLGHEEKIFLQTLIQLDNARSEEEKNLIRLWLNDLNPKKEYKILEAEHYHLIADWVHMAILTLAKVPNYRITAESVYRLVGEKVSLAKVREAIERLIELNLLREEGGFLKPTFESVRTKDDISSRGSRDYHKQVAALAAECIEEQAPQIREFQGFALTLRPENIPLAKDLIRKFRHQMVQLLEAEAGEEVYQCNVQFFRLAENPSTLSKVNESRIKTSESSIPSLTTPKTLEPELSPETVL